jgi:hypothetical protein
MKFEEQGPSSSFPALQEQLGVLPFLLLRAGLLLKQGPGGPKSFWKVPLSADRALVLSRYLSKYPARCDFEN